MTMEETTEDTANEPEVRDEKHQLSGDSMDGPMHSQNQETSSAMEEIIDNDDGDAETDGAPNDGGQ